MIEPINPLFLSVCFEHQRLLKEGFEFTGDLKVLGDRLESLHYTGKYLQFVADHCSDAKTLANFLNVPNDPEVIEPAKLVFERLLEKHSQQDVNAAMEQLRAIRERYFLNPNSKPYRNYQYKNLRPSLPQRLAQLGD